MSLETSNSTSYMNDKFDYENQNVDNDLEQKYESDTDKFMNENFGFLIPSENPISLYSRVSDLLDNIDINYWLSNLDDKQTDNLNKIIYTIIRPRENFSASNSLHMFDNKTSVNLSFLNSLTFNLSQKDEISRFLDDDDLVSEINSEFSNLSENNIFLEKFAYDDWALPNSVNYNILRSVLIEDIDENNEDDEKLVEIWNYALGRINEFLDIHNSEDFNSSVPDLYEIAYFESIISDRIDRNEEAYKNIFKYSETSEFNNLIDEVNNIYLSSDLNYYEKLDKFWELLSDDMHNVLFNDIIWFNTLSGVNSDEVMNMLESQDDLKESWRLSFDALQSKLWFSQFNFLCDINKEIENWASVDDIENFMLENDSVFMDNKYISELLEHQFEEAWFDESEINRLESIYQMTLDNKTFASIEMMILQSDTAEMFDKYFKDYDWIDWEEVSRSLTESREEVSANDSSSYRSMWILILEKFSKKLDDLINSKDPVNNHDLSIEDKRELDNSILWLTRSVDDFMDALKDKEAIDAVSNRWREFIPMLQDHFWEEELFTENREMVIAMLRYYVNPENESLEWFESSYLQSSLLLQIWRSHMKDWYAIDDFRDKISSASDIDEINSISHEYIKAESMGAYLEITQNLEKIPELKSMFQSDENFMSDISYLRENLKDEHEKNIEENFSVTEEEFEEVLYNNYIVHSNPSKYEQWEQNQEVSEIESEVDNNWPASSSAISYENWEPSFEYKSSTEASNPFYDPEDPNSSETLTWRDRVDLNKNILWEFFSSRWLDFSRVSWSADEFMEKFWLNLNRELDIKDIQSFWKVLWKHLVEHLDTTIDQYSGSTKERLENIREKIILSPEYWIDKFFAEFNQIDKLNKFWFDFVDINGQFNISNFEPWEHQTISSWYTERQRNIASEDESTYSNIKSSIESWLKWFMNFVSWKG